MSIEQTETQFETVSVSGLNDSEMKELLIVEEDDDNKLVTSQDLKSDNEQEEEETPTSIWSDPERIRKLRVEMQVISKVRLPEMYSEAVLLKAMAEVLAQLGWHDYDSFRETVDRILTGPPKSVPFAVKTRNVRTGKWDFWLIRVFINVSNNNVYTVNDTKYSKKDVLMSRQFCSYLRGFCEKRLNNEAQFWTFTGSFKGKQHLDMAKLNRDDMSALKAIGEIEKVDYMDPSNLVMFQFKMKSAEVMVGKVV
jgi:hypothetical protein